MHKQWILARRPPGGLPTDADFKLPEITRDWGVRDEELGE